MKISTEIYSAALHVGEEKTIELLAKAGFDAWDFSMFNMRRFDWNTKAFYTPHADHPLVSKDYLAFARKLRQIGLDNGITCNQSHAPFPSTYPEMKPWLQRAIECTAEAGGQIISVGSMAAKRANGNAPLYCTAKAAVNMLSAGMQIQYKEKNIRVTTLNPGGADTPFWGNRPVKRENLLKVSDVAEVIEFVLTRESRVAFSEINFESFLMM